MIDIEPSSVYLDGEALSEDEVNKRRQLGARVLAAVPVEAIERLQIIQPAIGCVNMCNFCSQVAGPVARELGAESLRAVFGGLKGAMTAMGVERVGYDRSHKESVIFPYLDNDIGSYPYLEDFLIGVRSLGGKSRISTVGWSRHNEQLQSMHQRINRDFIDDIDGIRFSLTPYTVGWRTNRDEYVQDLANSLATYEPYIKSRGKGKNTACIEMRFAPDAQIDELIYRKEQGYEIVECGEYTLILLDKDVKLSDLEQTRISSVDGVAGVLSAAGYDAICVVGTKDNYKIEDAIIASATAGPDWPVFLEDQGVVAQKGKVHLFENQDGAYLAFNPLKNHDTGTFSAVHFYPRTSQRAESGVLDARRPFLNTLMKMKHDHGIKPRQNGAPGEITAREVRERIVNEITLIEVSAPRRAKYMTTQVLPIIDAMVRAVELAGFPEDEIISYGLVFDTGIIVNQGKALSEFRGLASRADLPLTPNEERGYGDISQSSVRGNTWRIAPTLSSQDTHVITGLGKKSQVYVSDDANGLSLGVYEWNPQTFNNVDNLGNKLRSVQVPIGDLVDELIKITPGVAASAALRPGVKKI